MEHPILYRALLSILVNHINQHGKCDDAVVCKEMAHYIHHHAERGYGCTLYEFIYDFGEPEECDYLGRNPVHGEKEYHTWNPDTNWNARISKELKALGHYDKVA